MWEPISLTQLQAQIATAEKILNTDLLNFWKLIQINPEKWQEDNYGKEGNGFWVVAISGKKIVWYNDIEDGFNISEYHKNGYIDEYECEQDELNIAVMKLYKLFI